MVESQAVKKLRSSGEFAVDLTRNSPNTETGAMKEHARSCRRLPVKTQRALSASPMALSVFRL
jgi:hypothetical protein